MRVLVVEDEPKQCRMVADHLREAGHDVVAETSGAEGARLAGTGAFDVVVTDLKMEPVDGLAVLAAARQARAETEVVVMTAHATVESAVAAMKQGAADYVSKPFPLEELTLKLEHIAEKLGLRRQNKALADELATRDRLDEMVGSSAGLTRVKELAAKVAPADSTVLVLGESGVGKELVARMIHRLSPRAGKPFVVVHAAALPDTLLESELFGYEKGAFTGAVGQKPGRLEAANSGTLFLDEIGDISPAFQVKLLRFLQEKTFVRLGGAKTIAVDARVVAATNRNIEADVRAGDFREDLYYRLSVFPITVPPLRERRADVEPLARHILARLGYNREPEAAVLALLLEHDWPGNVRELENVLGRAMIMAAGEELGQRHIQLPEPVLVREAGSGGRKSLHEMEEEMLKDALNKAGGNKAKAARILGITRRMLYTKLAKYGMAESGDGDEK